ncbi:MAG: hypothetical protein AB7M05_08890 [Alphaproteobacteria bacterium]
MSLLCRYEDWPTRLEAAVETARTKPFSWGTVDCCLFAADCVEAITGQDLAAPYRGKYKTRRGALSILKRTYGGGVEAAANNALGMPLEAKLMARRGDVVLFDGVEGPALGICVGANCAYLGKAGLVFLPLQITSMAWRV